MYCEGDKILELSPFVAVLEDKKTTAYCSSCFKRLESPGRTRCGRCPSAHYCDSDCQKNHKLHEKECICLRRASDSNKFPDLVIRLVAQTMWKVKESSGAETSYTIRDKTYWYEDLPLHPGCVLTDSSNADPGMESLLKNKYEQFLSFVDDGPISFEEFCTLYGKVTKHMLPISEELSEVIGLGMYIGMASIKHSCRPNANVSFIGTTAWIVATCDFENTEPHTISVRLISTMAPTEVRQASLRAYNGETCNCELCQNEEFEGALNEVESGEEAAAVMDSAVKTLEDLERNSDKYGKEERKKTACDALTEMNGVAGDFNHVRGRMLKIAASSCLDLNQYEEAITYCEELLEIYRYIDGPNNVMVMQVLKQLSESYKETGDLVKARDYFSEYLEVVHNICGFEHPFFQRTRYDFCRMERSNWEQD